MASIRQKFHLLTEFFLPKKGLPNPSKSSSISRNSSCKWSDSDSDSEAEETQINGVPEGCLAVYVGDEKQRFVVRTDLLSHPLFKALLDRSAEEYGFEYEKGVCIPCEPVLFEHLVWLLAQNERQAALIQISDLLQFYSS